MLNMERAQNKEEAKEEQQALVVYLFIFTVDRVGDNEIYRRMKNYTENIVCSWQ